MPPKAWSDKRERQYEHIKEGYEKRGKPEGAAEAIAARTVNKERAQHGEMRRESGRTRAQLYEEAKRKGIAGRASMNKEQLQRAVDR